MRDGNYILSETSAAAFGVVSLPMRDGNSRKGNEYSDQEELLAYL